MNCYPAQNDLINVVFGVYFNVVATDDVYVASECGSAFITFDADAAFVPYDELTLSTVIDWVQKTIGPDMVSQIETSLAQNILDQQTPPVASPPLPWG